MSEDVQQRDPETNKPLCFYCGQIVENAPGMSLDEVIGFFHSECNEDLAVMI